MAVLWMIRAEGGKLVEHFLKHKIAAICFGPTREFTQPVNLEELKAYARRHYPWLAPGGITNGAKQLKHVIQDIQEQKRDWVMTSDPKNRRYWLGRVTSGYEFWPGSPLPREQKKGYPYVHTRDVDWDRTIEKDRLSARAQGHLGQQRTVFKVAEDVQAEIFRKGGIK